MSHSEQIRILLPLLDKIVTEGGGGWRAKRDIILDDLTPEERGILLEFASWFEGLE